MFGSSRNMRACACTTCFYLVADCVVLLPEEAQISFTTAIWSSCPDSFSSSSTQFACTTCNIDMCLWTCTWICAAHSHVMCPLPLLCALHSLCDVGCFHHGKECPMLLQTCKGLKRIRPDDIPVTRMLTVMACSVFSCAGAESCVCITY